MDDNMTRQDNRLLGLTVESVQTGATARFAHHALPFDNRHVHVFFARALQKCRLTIKQVSLSTIPSLLFLVHNICLPASPNFISAV